MLSKIKFFFLVPIFLLVCLSSLSAADDYRTRIAIVPMENNTGDSQYDAVCETVTDTVALVLQFLKDYLVFTAEEDPKIARISEPTPETLQRFGERERYDEIIFGSAELRKEGGFLFTLSLYNTYEQKIQVKETEGAESLFGIFDAADNITLKLISEVSDIRVAFGAIELKRGSGYGTYKVYLDDKRIRNFEQVFRKVLNGTYQLEIRQDRLPGEAVVYEEAIEVFENKTTTVTFDIPPASEEDFRYLEERAEELFNPAENSEKVESFLEGIADFQRETQKTGYDPELDAKKEEILAHVGEMAVSVLERLKEEGDALYYREKPDFQAALEKFGTVSELLNNVFDYTMIDDTEPELIQPQLVRAGENGICYTLGGGETGSTLRSFDRDGNELGRLSFEKPAVEFAGDMCTDAFGKLYFFDPASTEIIVYDSNLNEYERITVPDYEPQESEKMRIARSPSNVIYLIGNARAIVFDPVAETDTEGEQVIKRRPALEESILQTLTENARFDVSSVFFDSAERLTIFSARDKTVLRFDALGNFLSEITFSEAEADSKLTVDSLGYYYLILPEESRIVKYSPTGEIITRFGSFGEKTGEFSRPADVSVDNEGTIYVADTYNQRIQILELTAPPILVPQVARYGIDFKRRTEITENAIEKMERAKEKIKAGPIVGKSLASVIFFGGAFGLSLTSDVFTQGYLEAYRKYRFETDPRTIGEYKTEANIQWIMHNVAEMGSAVSFGVGTMFLVSNLLHIGEYATLKSRTIRNVQSLSLEKEYVLNEDKYKSLRAAKTIGVLTGVVPPLLGSATVVALTWAIDPDFDPLILSAIIGGSVAIPPIFSHAYGGRFNVGLFASGLVADGLALAALLMIMNAPEEGHPAFDDTPVEQEISAAQTFTNMSEKLPIYLMVGAVGVRLAAGIWDANYGWHRAHYHNIYRADTEGREQEKKSEFALFPLITPDGRLGVSGRLSF